MVWYLLLCMETFGLQYLTCISPCVAGMSCKHTAEQSAANSGSASCQRSALLTLMPRCSQVTNNPENDGCINAVLLV